MEFLDKLKEGKKKLDKWNEAQEFKQRMRSQEKAEKLEKQAAHAGQMTKNLERQSKAQKKIDKYKALKEKNKPKSAFSMGHDMGSMSMGFTDTVHNGSKKKKKQSGVMIGGKYV